MIHCACPGCQAPFEVDDSFAGQKVKCANCKAKFFIPDLLEAVSAPEICNWFYAKNNQQYGPVAEEVIVKMLSNGALASNTMVWMKDLEEWTAASSIPTFSNKLVKNSPVPPPLPGAMVSAQPTAITAHSGGSAVTRRIENLKERTAASNSPILNKNTANESSSLPVGNALIALLYKQRSCKDCFTNSMKYICCCYQSRFKVLFWINKTKYLLCTFIVLLLTVVAWQYFWGELKNPAEQFSLGVRYAKGEGVSKNAVKAVKWYRKAAERGYAEAQFNLGNCYRSGDGLPIDLAEAVKWYRKAAEQGHAQAQFSLGICHDFINGATRNISEAVRWYQKAAEQGHVKAQFNLGNCFYKGDGITKNLAEAVKWYRKAAEQGYAQAQYNLGNCFYKGDGVTKDLAEAVKWYQKAAEQGHAQAQYNLGCCYYNGEGFAKDFTQAVKIWDGCCLGDAQFQRGLCYYNGLGVPQDKEKGAEWVRQAFYQGLADAKLTFEAIEAFK